MAMANVDADPAKVGAAKLAALRPNAPQYLLDEAQRMLCHTFGPTDDRDYSRAYGQVISKIRKGLIRTEVVQAAFERAMAPSAENPGRVFAHHVNHYGATLPQRPNTQPRGERLSDASRQRLAQLDREFERKRQLLAAERGEADRRQHERFIRRHPMVAPVPVNRPRCTTSLASALDTVFARIEAIAPQSAKAWVNRSIPSEESPCSHKKTSI
jgi:hypothetical protein